MPVSSAEPLARLVQEVAAADVRARGRLADHLESTTAELDELVHLLDNPAAEVELGEVRTRLDSARRRLESELSQLRLMAPAPWPAGVQVAF